MIEAMMAFLGPAVLTAEEQAEVDAGATIIQRADGTLICIARCSPTDPPSPSGESSA